MIGSQFCAQKVRGVSICTEICCGTDGCIACTLPSVSLGVIVNGREVAGVLALESTALCGPDSEEKDRFRKDLVLAYGTLWDERLRQHWNDTAITIQEIATKLSVCEGTIIRQVKRLGLSYPRGSSVVVAQQGNESPELKLTPCQPMPEKIEARRRDWAVIIAANPKATRKELLKIAYHLYRWLRSNDREWFDANSPPAKVRRYPGRTVNWAEHDPELAAAIRASVQCIKSLPGCPVRASKAAVIREIGYQIWIENRLDKLPLTAKALVENLEPLEAYMIRKVDWATKFFVQKGRCPTRLQLMVKASVRNAAGQAPIVQDAINIAMAKLEANFPPRHSPRTRSLKTGSPLPQVVLS